MATRSLFAFGVLVVGLVVASAEPPAVAPPPRPAPRYIEELVLLLGSDDFAEREQATRALSTLDVNGLPPELLLATKSHDPEVRKRAAAAVTALRRRAERQALGTPAVFAKSGRVDLFVASAAAWHIPVEDDRVWQTVLDVAADLDRRDKFRWALTGRRPVVPTASFWIVCLKPQFVRSGVPFEVPAKNDVDRWWPGGVIAPAVTAAQSLNRTLILSRGPVRPARGIAESVVLANGNVSSNGLNMSVVVCDGNVDVVGQTSRSIVVARGDITVDTAANSTFVAGGRVTIREVPPPDKRPQPVPVLLRVKEGDRNPLGFVTFFELSQTGVEVGEADKVVRVKAVAGGQAFAAAGAKVGDMIEGVNGAKPESAEALRRLLRDALAVGDATVTVRRGNATHTLRVVLPE